MTNKTAEFKYKVTVSKSQKVNLGNYENVDVFESMTGGCDLKKDLKELREFLEGEVDSNLERRVGESAGLGKPGGDFQSSDKISTDKEIEEFVETSPTDDKWPDKIPCRKCNVPVTGQDSKFKAGEKYYPCDKCKDGEGKPVKTWPLWYRKLRGWA